MLELGISIGAHGLKSKQATRPSARDDRVSCIQGLELESE